MSQAGSFGNGGGGGGITEVLGQASLVAPTITVTTVGTTATVEDRSWETQYVVDSSTTQGLRGTYSTIQAAMNQAVSDGMSLANPKKIFIRYNNGVTYTENLTIPAGATLIGDMLPADPTALPIFPSITGNHTIASPALINFKNIAFINASPTVDTFTNSGISIFNAEGCVFYVVSGTGLHFTLDFTGNIFSNCLFSQNAFQNGIALTSNAQVTMTGCVMSSCGITGNGSIRAFDCQNFGPLTFSNGSINAYRSSFQANATDNISGTGAVNSLYDCTFVSNDQTTTAVTSSGGMQGVNNRIVAGSTGPGTLYPLNTGSVFTASVAACTGGSIYTGIRVNANYSPSQIDYYVAVTDTTAPRTITLPNAGVATDHVFIIKDESGAAAGNPISIVVSGGVKTIDGLTSQSINTNYGSLTVIYDGTNYFII